MKHAIYATVFLLLALVAWQFKIPIWFLFLCIAAYYAYRGIRGTRKAATPISEEPSYGEVRRFLVEGEEAFGLYLRLGGNPVFVDIKEDNLLKGRQARAMELFGAQGQLDASLAAFVSKNSEFATRRVASLGVHAKDLQRIEVFWEPTGYTLVRGLSFQPAQAESSAPLSHVS